MNVDQNNTSPKEVGLYLKQCRQEKGVSLNDISEVTKISPQLLRAIEEGQWEKLYSSFFLVNFLKAYCRVVGIPCDHAVRCAEKFFSPIDKKRAESYRKLLARRRPILINRGKIAFYVSVIFISMLMLFGGLFFSNRTERPPKIVNKLESHTEVPQEVVKALKIAPEVDSSRSGSSQQSGDVSKETVKPSGSSYASSTVPPKTEQNKIVEAGVSMTVHRLIVEATGETWVKVWTDDSDTPVSMLMTEGERVEFEVKERAKVRLSNAARAKIIWDDQVFERLGRKGRQVTLSFPNNSSSSSRKNVR